MTKLYDMYLQDKRNESVSTFQMRAPLHVILQTISLFNDNACRRVEYETQNNGICVLMKNGERWLVQRATKELGVEVETAQ